MRTVEFLTPHALLLHWRRCTPSRSHLRVLLPCFILWQIWKARNAFRFDSQSFWVIVIIHRVGLDLGLASSAFGFKTSQLRRVLDSRITEGLRIIAPPERPIRLVSWIRPPLGVIKLTVDRFSRGNPGMAALGGILLDHRGEVLAVFGSLLGHQPILYAELMAVYEGLDLAIQLGHSVLKVESDSTTMVSWIHSQGPVHWDYTYSLH